MFLLFFDQEQNYQKIDFSDFLKNRLMSLNSDS